MIYIVSGYMRTGTSMMMHALWKGGLVPVMNPNREKMNEVYGDEYYQPNAAGFWELTLKEFRKFGFPLEYDGRLIKVLQGGLSNLAVHEYRFVVMRRHPEEIRESFRKFFIYQEMYFDALNPYRKTQSQADYVCDNYERLFKHSTDILRNRKDVKSLTIVEFAEVNFQAETAKRLGKDVVENPLETFKLLRDVGWPIEPGKASEVVDPDLYRFRLNRLEVSQC